MSKAFEEKYYGGGKIAEGLTAAQAGKILDRLLKAEKETYGTSIPETDIWNIPIVDLMLHQII